jgi:hypothetical protein
MKEKDMSNRQGCPGIYSDGGEVGAFILKEKKYGKGDGIS